MKKWLIVQAYWYFDEITGEFHYRVKQPARGLNQQDDFHVLNVHVFHPFFPYFAENADLLIMHLLPDVEATSAIHFRKKRNLPTFFEIADNFLEVGPWVPEHDAHRDPEIRQNLLYNASLCDGLQINNSRLKDPFGELNKNLFLYENQIDKLQTPNKKSADHTFTIGWGGSIGHKTDLIPILDPLKQFLRTHSQTRFAYMGQEELFNDLFSDFPSDQCHFQASGSVESYYDFLSKVDLGIAPLGDTEFNRCRSDIKHLEFAAMGAGSLLARTSAYQEHHENNGSAFFFNSPSHFMTQLQHIFSDRTALANSVQFGQKYIRSNRWFEDLAAQKAIDYAKVITTPKTDQTIHEMPSAKNLMTYIRSGINHMEQANFDRSKELFDKAISQLPNYHQAHYWKRELLLRMDQPMAVLESAANYQPSPIYEDVFIQQIAAAAKIAKPEIYEAILEQIQDADQRYALAPERHDPLQVLTRNPFHFDALKRLAKHVLEKRDMRPEWIPWMKWANKMAPNNEDVQACLEISNEWSS